MHGDDFTILGWQEQLEWFWNRIKERFECKHRGRIGPGDQDNKQMRILNRIVTWTKEGIEYEGDQRHVDICMKEMSLDYDAREVVVPIDKNKNNLDKYGLEKPKEEIEVGDKSLARKFRGMTARLNYLGQDRSDIQYAVKELSSKMANPDEDDMGKLKKVVRYLKGRPRYRTLFEYQEKPDNINVWTDTDFGGCKRSRKSTSGGVIMHGKHTIKTWSTNQAVIALSSGEAEYYGMVKGASVAMGVNALCEDLGRYLSGKIKVQTDASAAIGIACRIGTGKIRHIEINQLWLQEKVAQGRIEIVKIGTLDNLADALTKAVDGNVLRKHIQDVGGYCCKSRHELAPSVENDLIDHDED